MEGRPERMLVTGANRGIGLGFTALWLEQERTVFALCRAPERAKTLEELAQGRPGRLHVVACDIGDEQSVQRARAEVERHTDTLDAVVNNAGAYGSRSDLASLDLDEVKQTFDVNALGPLRVTRAFLPLLARSHVPRLVHITSLMGSIEDNTSGGSWAYRMSKAALNMASRNLGHELAGRGIPSVVLHPGWVQTDMGGASAPLPLSEAVSELTSTIDAISMEHSGTFLDRKGEPLPW
jgi:NAD(P)-dependent dehydrogenase (short-subunit alcohol dehydrogenase family)